MEKLEIIGSGPEEKNLRKLVSDTKLGERIDIITNMNYKSIEEKWNEDLNKKNPKIKSELESMINHSNLNDLEKIIREEKAKYFTEKPDMATRQCSSAAIETISSILPQLIGGSADLSLSLIHI